MHKDIIIAITGKAVSLICLVVIIGILARKISGIDFGLYMLYLGSVPFAAVLIQLGLHQVMMRRVADQLEQNFLAQSLLNESLKKICFVSAFIGTLTYYFASSNQTVQAIAGIDQVNIGLAVVWVVMATMQLTLADAFKAFNSPSKTFIYGESGSAACLLLFLVLMSFTQDLFDLESVLLVSIASIAIFVAIGFVDLQRTVKQHDAHSKPSDTEGNQIGYMSGVKIWAGYSLGLAFYPITLWFVGFYGGPVQAGEFAIASKLAGLTLLPVLVTNSLMPRRVSEYKVNKTKKNEIQNLNALAITASLSVIIVVTFAGGEIVDKWLGGEYENALRWAPWLQIGKLVTSVCGASAIILVIYHQDRRFVEAGLIGMAVLLGILYMPMDIDFIAKVVLAAVASAIVHSLYQFYFAFKSLAFFFPFAGVSKDRKFLNPAVVSNRLTAIRKPNLVIIGTPKSGTTTLYDVLRNHKDIYLPEIKEPTFFNDNENYKWGFDYYLQAYYAEAKDQPIVADCTPLYIGSKVAAERIYKHLGKDVKIIILLRDPNERAFSHYVHNKKSIDGASYARMIEKNSAGLDYADCIWFSMYYSLIKIWENKFGRKNILIIKFEDEIVNDLQKGVDKICQFLGIDSMQAVNNMQSNAAKRSIRGLSGARLWLYSNSSIKLFIKKLFSPKRRQAIRILFDEFTTTEIKNKEKLGEEEKMNIYIKYFHKEMIKLKEEYGIDYVIR